MAVSDHLPRTARWKGRIVTSDPVTQRIEVVLGDGVPRQVSPQGISRWPIEGEIFTIYQENQDWILGPRWTSDQEPFSPRNIEPGQMILDATEIFDANGDPIGGSSGQTVTQTIGNGVDRVFVVTHPFNTKAVNPLVYKTASPSSEVTADIEHTDDSSVTIRTSASQPPLALGEYTVAISGPGAAVTQTLAMDSWHTVGAAGEPAFQNGWGNYEPAATTWQPASFRKDPFGKVWLRGSIKGGPSATVVFTLPVGFRPPKGLRFNSAPGTQDATAWQQVNVQADGLVYVWGSSVASIQSLDGISFDTDSVTSMPSIIQQSPRAVDTYSYRAGWQMSGGGVLNWDGSNFKWSTRLIVIAQGHTVDTAPNGFFDITLPPVGTVIPGVGGAGNVTVVTAGVPIPTWMALYYILPLGEPPNSLPANFRIVNYTADFEVPPNWVRVASQNSDDGMCYVAGRGPIDYWRNAALAAGSAYYGAPFNTPGYRKDSNGFVHLRGLVTVATVGATIFTLPAGYRPIAQELLTSISNSAIGRIDVRADGAVLAAQGVATGWFALDGLTFFAGQ